MFTLIETNFKGREVTATLGPCTAIIGENRSGKTAIIRAFRAACEIKPPAAQASRYFKFAPKDAILLYSKLSGPFGEAEFSAVKDANGHPRAPIQTFSGQLATMGEANAERMLPACSLRDLVDLGPSKAREALFRRFGNLTLGAGVPTPMGLSAASQEVWERAVAACVVGRTDMTEVLTAVGEWLRKEKRRVGAEITVQRKNLTELRTNVDLDLPGAELLPKLQEQYNKAVIFESQAAARQELLEARQRLDALHESASACQTLLEEDQKLAEQDLAEVARLSAFLVTQQEERLAASYKHEDVVVRLNRAETVAGLLDRMAEAKIDQCPVCTSSGIKVAERQKVLNELVASRKQEWKDSEALAQTHGALIETTQMAIRRLETKIRDRREAIESKQRAIGRDVSQTETRIDYLERTTSQLAEYTGPSSSSLTESIKTLNEAAAMRAVLEAKELEVSVLKTTGEVCRDLEERSELMLERLLKSVATNAEAAVNKYMPEGFVASLKLGDGECSWQVLGPEDNEPQDKTTMSGAEKASLTVALALAWTDGAPYRVVLLDDEDVGPFHSSPGNLTKLLTSLEKAVSQGHLSQLVVAGIRASEVPQGWTVVQR